MAAQYELLKELLNGGTKRSFCLLYTSQGNNALALSNGISTFKVAVALAIGISLVLCIPIPKKHG